MFVLLELLLLCSFSLLKQPSTVVHIMQFHAFSGTVAPFTAKQSIFKHIGLHFCNLLCKDIIFLSKFPMKTMQTVFDGEALFYPFR